MRGRGSSDHREIDLRELSDGGESLTLVLVRVLSRPLLVGVDDADKLHIRHGAEKPSVVSPHVPRTYDCGTQHTGLHLSDAPGTSCISNAVLLRAGDAAATCWSGRRVTGNIRDLVVLHGCHACCHAWEAENREDPILRDLRHAEVAGSVSQRCLGHHPED